MERDTRPTVERGEAVLVSAVTGADGPPSLADLQGDAPRVLEITNSGTAADCRARWDGTLPVSLAVIEVGPEAGSSDAPDIPVERVDSVDDLTGIGIAVSTVLDSWGSSPELVVRFDSVSVLLQYVDTRTVFQFLHTLAGRLSTVGARSWFSLDPALHDEQTLATVTAAFDGRLRRVDGTWRRD